jgi:hypothetical protein
MSRSDSIACLELGLEHIDIVGEVRGELIAYVVLMLIGRV